MHASKAGSYQEMLRKAQENRGVPPSSLQQQQQQAEKAPLEAPIPSLTGNRNGLPFSDEVYDHLKFAIEKLSARIKSDTALTPQELDRLKLSVDRIILDANIPNVAFASSSSSSNDEAKDAVSEPRARFPAAQFTDPDEEDGGMNDDDEEVGADNSVVEGLEGYSTPDAANKFFNQPADKELPEWLSDMAGTKSGWNVPGMDKMSTEEYYRNVNSRLTTMKNKRMSSGVYEHEATAGYLDSLNSKNRSG